MVPLCLYSAVGTMTPSSLAPAMRLASRLSLTILLVTLGVPAAAAAQAAARDVLPPVTKVPESFFALLREEDREVARRFYGKHIDVKGMPVVASAARSA